MNGGHPGVQKKKKEDTESMKICERQKFIEEMSKRIMRMNEQRKEKKKKSFCFSEYKEFGWKFYNKKQ